MLRTKPKLAKSLLIFLLPQNSEIVTDEEGVIKSGQVHEQSPMHLKLTAEKHKHGNPFATIQRESWQEKKIHLFIQCIWF